MSVANGMGLNSKVQILMVSEFENDIMSTTKNYNRIETFIMTSTNKYHFKYRRKVCKDF